MSQHSHSAVWMLKMRAQMLQQHIFMWLNIITGDENHRSAGYFDTSVAGGCRSRVFDGMVSQW